MSEQAAIYWTNCQVKLGDLKPWARNPKTISKAHARRLLANHKDFGQWQDVAIGPENEVYDGHQRLNVWLAAYGPEYEITAKRASRALTEQERERFVIEAHVGTVGSLNYDALANWNAPGLMEAGFDADLLKDLRLSAAAVTNFLGSEAQPNDPMQEWEGMPEYNQDDIKPVKDILVHFYTDDDIKVFSELIGQKITKETKSIWFPVRPVILQDQLGTKVGLIYSDES